MYRCFVSLLAMCLCLVDGLHSQLTHYKNIESLKKKITAVGKLSFKKDIPIRYMDKDRLREYLAARFDADYPGELSVKEGVFIRLMGFVDNEKKRDVRGIRKQILLDNARGLYDGKTHELLVLDEYRDIDFIHAMMLAHELRHALQDQYFDLSSPALMGGYSDFDDRRLAVLAAVEGDAAFLMVQCSDMDADVLTSSPDADALFSFVPVARPSLLYGESSVFKYQLLMPYLDGLRFVNAVFKKKKWNGVNEILRYPPESTEQILHPGKYLKREKPVNVTIGYKPDGYRLYHSGVIGEYYLDVLLKPENNLTLADAAQGWGGDTFHIYMHTTGSNLRQASPYSYFLVWESVWDKDSYCSHFYADFKRFIEKRFQVNFKDGNVKGNDFIAGQSQSGGGYFFLMKSRDRLFYVRSENRIQMNAFIYGGKYD